MKRKLTTGATIAIMFWVVATTVVAGLFYQVVAG